MSRSDRVIGISLGLVIGVVALILFIWLGSKESIDAPSIDTKAPVEQSVSGGNR